MVYRIPKTQAQTQQLDKNNGESESRVSPPPAPSTDDLGMSSTSPIPMPHSTKETVLDSKETNPLVSKEADGDSDNKEAVPFKRISELG